MELKKENNILISINKTDNVSKTSAANEWANERKVYEEKLIKTLQKQEKNQVIYINQLRKKDNLVDKMQNGDSYFNRAEECPEKDDLAKRNEVKSIYLKGLKNQISLNEKLRNEYGVSREKKREILVQEIICDKKEEEELKARQLKIKQHYRNLLQNQVVM